MTERSEKDQAKDNKREEISKNIENVATGYTFGFGNPIRICVTLTKLNEVGLVFLFINC